MAHSNNSIITGKLKGSLGKELVFREWGDKTVVAKSPKKRKGEPTPAQAETQEKFLMASRYAKAVISSDDQDMAEAYAGALRPRQNLYSRAVEDFMSYPKINSINTRTYKGAVGDKLTIRATDDFRISGVSLEIYAADGSLLEAGEAQLDTKTLEWIYTATQANNLLAGSTIKAIATDIPNNEGILEVKL